MTNTELPAPDQLEPSTEIDSPDFPVPFADEDRTPPVVVAEVPHADLAVAPAPGAAEVVEREKPIVRVSGSFTPMEVQIAMNLRAQNYTFRQIAERMGRSHEGVRHVLNEWASTVDLAKVTLRKGAVTLAERVIKDANVEQSLEALDRLEVLPKRDKGTDNRVQVVLGINIDDAMPKTLVTNIEEPHES